jgi:hypothetical protein
MSDPTPAAGNPGDEPDVQDEAHEAEMMRAVMRTQEKHREGGIDRELDDTDGESEPGAGADSEPGA